MPTIYCFATQLKNEEKKINLVMGILHCKRHKQYQENEVVIKLYKNL